MANWINNGAHNWTGAVWGATDATCLQATVSSSTVTTTSMVYSTAQACDGVLDIDGLLLHCKQSTVTGTVSVTLNNSVSDQQTVTVNATDLPTTAGWHFFKFSAPVTVSAVGVWKIGISGSSAGNATFYRDGTAGNWAHILRKTTQGTPANTDNVYIAGEYTAAATSTARTVTMDNTSALGTTDIAAFNICGLGTLLCGTSASTNYHLGFSSSSTIWPAGTLSFGTSGTRMPATSTATLEPCNNSTLLVTQVGSTFNLYGATMAYTNALLAADAAGGATSLTTNVSTGWANGDTIALAATTRTYTQCESKALTAGASGTTLTIAALANSHTGTSPIQSELINLTRNVRYIGKAATSASRLSLSGGIINFSYAEFSNGGSSIGFINYNNTTDSNGSLTMVGCSIHDCTGASAGTGLSISGSVIGYISITDWVSYNIYTTHLLISATNTLTVTINGFIGIFTTNSAAGGSSGGIMLITKPTTSLSLSNITCIGSASYGFGLTTVASNNYPMQSDVTTITCHSNNLSGIQFGVTGIAGTTIICGTNAFTNLTLWRNNASGIAVMDGCYVSTPTFTNVTAFGNATAAVNITGAVVGATFNTATFNAGVTLTQPIGLAIAANGVVSGMTFNGGTFGATTTHATADASIAAAAFGQVVFRSTNLASGTAASISATAGYGSYIAESNKGAVANTHKVTYLNGTIQNDATTYQSAAPSALLTPSSATLKLKSGSKKRGADSSTTYTVSVAVRKSATYNGNQPRLMQKADIGGGIADDVVIDTMAVAVGNWETITGTTTAINYNGVVEFYVDCDGTVGAVNVDDWTIT